MTTIIKDKFSNGDSVSLDMHKIDMHKQDGELYVFHYTDLNHAWTVSKWPLDSYHLPIAVAHYEACCEKIRQNIDMEV